MTFRFMIEIHVQTFLSPTIDLIAVIRMNWLGEPSGCGRPPGIRTTSGRPRSSTQTPTRLSSHGMTRLQVLWCVDMSFTYTLLPSGSEEDALVTLTLIYFIKSIFGLYHHFVLFTRSRPYILIDCSYVGAARKVLG